MGRVVAMAVLFWYEMSRGSGEVLILYSEFCCMVLENQRQFLTDFELEIAVGSGG